MADEIKNKFFDNREKYLKGLYTSAKEGWESDRKVWYLENAALANDINPLNEYIEQGAFAPHVPIITPAIGIRLSEIESVQLKTERPYLIKPFVEPSDPEKKANAERVIERVYARIEFAKQISGFKRQMKAWRHNAEIYPASFLYLTIEEIEADLPEEIMEPVMGADEYGNPQPSGENRYYEYKPQVVYVGPTCFALQPEQVLVDPDATCLDMDYCKFAGFRKTVDVDYILSKYPTDVDGEEITREDLEPKKTDDNERAEALEEQGYGRQKKLSGIELITLYHRVLDDTPEKEEGLDEMTGEPKMSQPSGKMRLRCNLFICAAGNSDKTVIVLKDSWTDYKGKNARRYPMLVICAEARPGEIEGHSTVDNGKSSQYEIDDLVRMRMEAGARAIYPKEIVKSDNVISPQDRVAYPYERTVVRDINGIRVEAVYNPSIAQFVEEQKMFHEIAMNRMAADAVLPTASLTDQSDETATATRRREAIFNSRLGLTFDIYSEGEKDATEWYFEAIKQLSLEGKTEDFERQIFGVDEAMLAEFSVEDLLLDVRFEITPYAALAKRDLDRLMSQEFFTTLMPLVQSSPENPFPQLSEAAIILIEDYWRDSGKSETRLQEILKPFKEQNAIMAAFKQQAAGIQTAAQPQGGLNGATRAPLSI